MARSLNHSHIARDPDGTVVGHWGPYLLHTAFQPIFAFEGNQLHPHAFEALVRPSRGGSPLTPNIFFKALPPGERLPVEGLARDLQIRNAAIALGPDPALFINFDPSLFSDRKIVDSALSDMHDAVSKSGLRRERIVCEVTEQSSGSAAALEDFVTALRSDGYRVAVDDYGTQSSDMERVKQLRPDIVKFDAKWIVRLMVSRPGIALLAAIVEEFRHKNIQTIFEGIEEEWQIDVAAEIGVSMVQGFALARPEIARAGSRENAAMPGRPTVANPYEPPPGPSGPGRNRTGAGRFGRRGL